METLAKRFPDVQFKVSRRHVVADISVPDDVDQPKPAGKLKMTLDRYIQYMVRSVYALCKNVKFRKRF